jgi:hypothetical protein
MTTKAKRKRTWKINHWAFGECVILPNSIRYTVDAKHCYGHKVAFSATAIRVGTGERVFCDFSGLGTTRSNAICYALR